MNKKSNFSKSKQQLMRQQTTEIKQLEQIATPKYKYSSSQTMEFHPLLRTSEDHSTVQL